jgi:hypothetical protein
MPNWFEELWRSLVGPKVRPDVSLFSRHVRLSARVIEWLRSPARTSQELSDFAQLLLRLDSDPIGWSEAVLGPGALPGLRWAPCGDYSVMFIVDPGNNRLSVVLLQPHGGRDQELNDD